jgi:hypothetical protein
MLPTTKAELAVIEANAAVDELAATVLTWLDKG